MKNSLPHYLLCYLNKLEISDPIECDLKSLSLLKYRHLTAFGLDTIDSLYQRPFKLEAKWIIEERILKENRGGLCIFLNGAFCHLLCALGFDANLVSVHVRAYNSRYFEYEIESHAAIVVHLDGNLYLVDVGFGDSFRTPLPFGKEAVHIDGLFKIMKNSGNSRYEMHKNCEGIWHKQYDFLLIKRELISFQESMNYVYSSDHDFSHTLLFNKPCKVGYKYLVNNKLTEITMDGAEEDMVIEDLVTLKAIIQSKFGVTSSVVNKFVTSVLK